MLTLRLIVLTAVLYTRCKCESFVCGIEDERFAIEVLKYCYKTVVEPVNWTKPPIDINCEKESSLQVNCSETEVTWNVSSPTFNFIGSCSNSSGIYGEPFYGPNSSINLPNTYTECIFSACYEEVTTQGPFIYHYINSTICNHPNAKEESTTEPIGTTESSNESISTIVVHSRVQKSTTPYPESTLYPESNSITIKTATIIFGVSVCFLTTASLIVMCGMVAYYRRWKRRLKNMSIKRGKLVLDDSNIPSEDFEPMKNIIRPISLKSLDSICDPLYKHLEVLHPEENIHIMKPRTINLTSNYYKQQQATSNLTDMSDGSMSLLSEDEGKKSVQILSFDIQPNSLNLQQLQPFEKPYYDISVADDSGYMDTENKRTAASNNSIESCESDGQRTSLDLFIDSNLGKLYSLDAELGHLPDTDADVSATTEERGYVIAQKTGFTNTSDDWVGEDLALYCENGVSSGGYLENTNRMYGASQYDYESSVNFWEPPYEAESENIELQTELCLDEDQKMDGNFMTYFGDEEEASSGYILDTVDHHLKKNHDNDYYTT